MIVASHPGTLVHVLPASADHLLIAANPKAGSGAKREAVDSIAALARQRGWQVQVLTDLAEVTRQVERLLPSGRLRALVGAGGDGTAAELVNRTPPGTPIALLPLGTENLLARYIEAASTPELMIETLAAGRVVQFDAARADGRIFLLMASVGFDADVVRRLHRNRRGNISHLSYGPPLLESLRNYRYPELRLHWEGQKRPAKAKWAFIFNLPCYAGGLPFCPDAIGTDGQLDVCVFRRGSLFHGLRYLMHIIFRRHHTLPDFSTTRVTRVRIEADRPVPYQLDGDPGGHLPVEIETLPGRLTLVVPTAWAEKQVWAAPPAPPAEKPVTSAARVAPGLTAIRPAGEA